MRAKKTKEKKRKINREELLSDVSRMTGVSPDMVDHVSEAIVSRIVEAVAEGQTVSIMGFGKFYPSLHKGHPVQFGSPDAEIHDYLVFKFQASNTMNDRLRASAGEFPMTVEKKK